MPPSPSSISRVQEIPPFCIRAEFAPSSINEENRSVEVTFSTGAQVKRFDWRTGEYFLEELALGEENVRLDRLNSGAPVLDTHSGWSLSALLGTVQEGTAKVTGKKGLATLRFSRRDEVAGIWRDVQDRIISKVSVGYVVHRYEETKGAGNKLAVRKAVDWEPYEISMVPMPADNGAQTRADMKPETHPCEIVTREVPDPVVPTRSEPMNPQNPAPTGAAALTPQSDTIVTERSTIAPAPTGTADPVEPNDRDRGVDQERKRVQGILQAVRAARLPEAFGTRLIAAGTDLLSAQSEIFTEIARRDVDAPRGSAAPVVRMGNDPLVHIRAGIENAILHRVAPALFKLEDIGREYRGLGLMDIARTFLQAQNIRTTGLSRLEIAGLALGLNVRVGFHTTSDFALLLADVAGKTLRRAYDEAPQTFVGTIGRRVTLPDFKPVKRLQLGEAPELLEVDEHGEFTRGTIGEGREQFQLATYGRVFAITRKALINDDTDAFSRIPMLFGRAARNLESAIVWAQITTNPVMGDGNALFSAAHTNLQTDGDVISIASLSRARAAMRLQTGLDGATLLNLVPRFLIVPPSLETVAEQYVGVITAATAANANPFSGKLQVVTEARLEAASPTAWYLGASVDQVDIVEYAFLEGEEGPAIESRIGFDVDGLEIKARHDFAAKAIDWRGLHKDPGENVS